MFCPGDPLDFIASGPTVANTDPPGAALEVVQRYGLEADLSPTTMNLLGTTNHHPGPEAFQHVTNTIIGSNRVVLEKLAREAAEAGMVARVVSRTLAGEARVVGAAMARLALALAGVEVDGMEGVVDSLGVDEGRVGSWEGGRLALLFGGETTVKVTGRGRGGRNQEMVLAFHLAMGDRWRELEERGVEVEFLSAGTDGLDGPTDAAGALWTHRTPGRAGEGARAEDRLTDNDSYTFWKDVGGLVMTGHTGTNVMDVQILLLRPISSPMSS